MIFQGSQLCCNALHVSGPSRLLCPARFTSQWADSSLFCVLNLFYAFHIRIFPQFSLYCQCYRQCFNKADLSNYRPIANLSFVSKLTNKIVKKRLPDHLNSNSLLNPYQSAYTKFYFTETTLLSLHDHLSNAISMQQVSCLFLLDLSAAFDTPDHSIILYRLSTWFGISSGSLQWFTSYLSSCTSTVGIPPHSSPSSPLTCGVSQGSVLGLVLFNLYTTALSSLISASSISHLLYADDTQLFISFVPKTSRLL